MGATRYFKQYTQEKCQQALEEGFSVGVVGEIKPETDKVTIPHEVITVYNPPYNSSGKIIGFNINKIYYSNESIKNLVERYTKDILYDSHQTETKMSRSEARAELLKIGKDALKPISEEIKSNLDLNNIDYDLFMGYVSLLYDIIKTHKLLTPPYGSNIKYGEQDLKVWIEYCQTNG